jgi:hypothetical protein
MLPPCSSIITYTGRTILHTAGTCIGRIYRIVTVAGSIVLYGHVVIAVAVVAGNQTEHYNADKGNELHKKRLVDCFKHSASIIPGLTAMTESREDTQGIFQTCKLRYETFYVRPHADVISMYRE